jgi:DNA-binding beta-propeller fold protein YncE
MAHRSRQKNERRSRPAAVLALCLLLGALQGCGSSDPRGHRVLYRGVPVDTVEEFGTYGTSAGQLVEPFGVAVDQRNGDVYVVDTKNLRIQKFTSAGRFLLAWGWGVADGKTQALQTCTKTCFAGREGGAPGQFYLAQGIAVDNDPSSPSRGDVYVVNALNYRIDKFSPTGKFLLTFGRAVNQTARGHHDRAEEDVCPVKPGDVCDKGIEGSADRGIDVTVDGSYIAVGANGRVYVGGRNRVKTFSPEGVLQGQIKLTPAPAPGEGREIGGVRDLAVNAAGDLYVVRDGVAGVREYAPSGKLTRTLEPSGEPAYLEGTARALALDPAGNVFVDVYSNYLHRIDEYSAGGARIASFDRGVKAPPGIADKEDALPGMAYDSQTNRLYMVNADVNVIPAVARVRAVMPPRP